jgi:murein DD-endopeptidase MepM/ murein hydrolase activator NlpD
MNELFAEAEADLSTADGQVSVAEGNLVEARRVEEQERRELEEERRRIEEERRRREEMARARAGPAGGVGLDALPGFICPVAGRSSFVDSWGAPRSGGRTHKGTDLMAARGTPLVAVADGVVEPGYGSLGGNTVWLHGDYGVSFFYAHLDAFAPGLSSGDRVTLGQEIGTVGDTGNPAPGAYHLHFGIYPGGVAVNPYPAVRAVCS